MTCFVANLGYCTIMRAEFRETSIGFRIAWELAYMKIHLQMDSLAVVDTIHTDADIDGRHCLLIHSIQEWRNRDWEVRISHDFREANRKADLLAHLGHGLPLGTRINCSISQDIERCIMSDCIRVAFPRVCSHSN
ncbi:Putative ribonuclease H protein At1g65750 [Linum perenne]